MTVKVSIYRMYRIVKQRGDWRLNLKPANICLLLESRSPPRLLGLDYLRVRRGMLRSNPAVIIREVLFFEYHHGSDVRGGLNTCRAMCVQDSSAVMKV